MLKKHKFISNSISILSNRLTQSISTFVLTATIARTLGAEALGQYLLAFSYYFIFVSIFSQGLKTLFTRELAQQPEKISIFLTHGTLVQLFFSVIGYVALVVLVFLLPYSAETSSLCYIFGLTIIPFSLSNITEAIFQAQEQMHLIAISTVPIYILRLLIMMWALKSSYRIETIAEIFLISESIILIIEFFLILPIVKLTLKIDRALIWKILKTARTFLAIEGIAVINYKFQILLLSLLGDEILVGIYGGIEQLFQPFLIIANSIATAMFPALSKAVDRDTKYQRRITEDLIEILLIVGLPLFIGYLFFGKDLLIFLYHSSFAQGDLALTIVSFSLVLLPFNRTLPFLRVAHGYEKINLYILILNTILGGCLGIVLVSQFKLLGSSITDLLTIFLSFMLNVYHTCNYLFPLNFFQLVRRPLIIGISMIPVFILLRLLNLNFLLVLLLSSFYYILITVFVLARNLDLHQTMLKFFKKI